MDKSAALSSLLRGPAGPPGPPVRKKSGVASSPRKGADNSGPGNFKFEDLICRFR